jgi:hypothetical protein
MTKKLEPMTVQELWEALTLLKPKARVLLHVRHKDGRVVEGELLDRPPDFGVGDDKLNVVVLYGRWLKGGAK